MIRRHGESCASDLKLDRSLAGELSEDEQNEVHVHLQTCDGCRARHASLLESRQSFGREAASFATFEEHPVDRSQYAQSASLATAIAPSGGLEPRRSSGTRSRALTGAFALAAAAAIVLARNQPWTFADPASRENPGHGTRAKGSDASLSWFVRRGERVFTGHPEQRLRAGDAVRFTVSSPEPVYVAVLGLDAGGRLSVYHPDGDRLTRVEPGRDQPLPTAIELDATAGQEQLYGVFCSSSLPLSEVTLAFERTPAAPALPRGCSVERSTLNKEPP